MDKQEPGGKFDVMQWVASWEMEMQDRGYPRARLDLRFTGGEVSYGFTTDVNLFVESLFDQSAHERWHEHEREGWMVAHETFVKVDHKRPVSVRPSTVLYELLSGLRTLDGERARLFGND